MSINFNIRMDESLKERAFPIIEIYGLTPAQSVTLFLNQLADTQDLPLSLAYKAGKIPNAVTIRALKEAIAKRSNTAPPTSTQAAAIQAMQELASE